jgi:catechol 2,3-dioxygenase
MTKPQLKHMGIYVHDIERMERFYTGVFSLTVTDRGKVARLGNRNIVFMSSAADAHHQLVLIDGKDPQSGPSVIFQMSFYLRSLDQLRFVRDQLVLHGATDITPLFHTEMPCRCTTANPRATAWKPTLTLPGTWRNHMANLLICHSPMK